MTATARRWIITGGSRGVGLATAKLALERGDKVAVIARGLDPVAMRKEREVGTVSPGKYADIIAVRGDVLRYINLLQRVDIVVKRGTRYK